MTKVSTEDWIAINDLLARYCWATDEGRGEEWANLWTEDGVFSGISPEPIVGREALKAVPLQEYQMFGGKMRHIIASLTCRYGDTKDIVRAKAYSYVTTWGDDQAMGSFAMALADMTLVRRGDDWTFQRNHSILMTR